MSFISISDDRLFEGNEYWRSSRAIDELEVYCDLLEIIQGRRESLSARGRDEEAILTNVQAVISSYAIEIAIKSLWALENSSEPVPHSHNLLMIFDDLQEDTANSLKQFGLTRVLLERWPKPFLSNRYSMESNNNVITVYPTRLLRPFIQLLRDKLEESKEALLKPPTAPIP